MPDINEYLDSLPFDWRYLLLAVLAVVVVLVVIFLWRRKRKSKQFKNAGVTKKEIDEIKAAVNGMPMPSADAFTLEEPVKETPKPQPQKTPAVQTEEVIIPIQKIGKTLSDKADMIAGNIAAQETQIMAGLNEVKKNKKELWDLVQIMKQAYIKLSKTELIYENLLEITKLQRKKPEQAKQPTPE